MKRLVYIFVCFLVAIFQTGVSAQTVGGQDMGSDSVAAAKGHNYSFRPNQLIAPGVMLAAGVTGVYAFHGFRNSVRHHFSWKTHRTAVDDYLQMVPGAVYIGLGFIPGVNERGDWRDRLMAGVTAFAITTAATGVIKLSLREPRPDGSGRTSFPSGHCARAFAGAELMRLEYGNWVGAAGYVAAVAVGVLRIGNDRHWINDVVGGAAVGILSARIAYWLLPWERRVLGLDRRTAPDVALMPMVGSTNGVALAIRF